MATEYIKFDAPAPYGVPIGCCIYCRSTEDLSDEHIVPFSLGADIYLTKASCAQCAGKLSYVEGYSAREIFGPLRVLYRIQSRRKNIRLNDVPVMVTTELGEVTRMVPRAELPVWLALPLFDLPGILNDDVPAPLTSVQTWIWEANDARDRLQMLRQPGDKSIRLEIATKPEMFARAIAKIGHAFAVGRFSIDGFRPYLPDIIFGRNPNIAYLIGGAEPPTTPQTLPLGTHRASHHTMTATLLAREGKPTLLATTIRLFSFTGSPAYWVIVGEASWGTIADLMADTPAPTP